MLPVDNPQRIVIPKRGLSREESVVSLPAESRFFADKSGFGMTRGRLLLRLQRPSVLDTNDSE